MNNSLVKLEDFQLDEISGDITAEQVGAYMIKRVCALSGSVVYCATIATCVCSGIGWRLKSKGVSVDNFDKEIWSDDMRKISALGVLAILGSFSIGGAYGWKFGEWICKKIGLED